MNKSALTREKMIKQVVLLLSCLSVQPIRSNSASYTLHKKNTPRDLKLSLPCDSHVTSIVRKYSISMLVSALIGTCTGTGCRYTRKYMHWLPAWMIWIVIRQELLECAQEKIHACNLMDKAELAECHDLMTSVAWIADWLNYLS